MMETVLAGWIEKYRQTVLTDRSISFIIIMDLMKRILIIRILRKARIVSL